MKGQMLSRMLILATQRHDGQFDKGGKLRDLETPNVPLNRQAQGE